jgi:hypothetical protein
LKVFIKPTDALFICHNYGKIKSASVGLMKTFDINCSCNSGKKNYSAIIVALWVIDGYHGALTAVDGVLMYSCVTVTELDCILYIGIMHILFHPDPASKQSA